MGKKKGSGNAAAAAAATRTVTISNVGGEAKPNWQAKSEAFRNAMKQARMVSKAEEQSKMTGIPLHQLLPASAMSSGPAEVDPSFIQCPTCGRSFSQKAGERHIPQVS